MEYIYPNMNSYYYNARLQCDDKPWYSWKGFVSNLYKTPCCCFKVKDPRNLLLEKPEPDNLYPGDPDLYHTLLLNCNLLKKQETLFSTNKDND